MTGKANLYYALYLGLLEAKGKQFACKSIAVTLTGLLYESAIFQDLNHAE